MSPTLIFIADNTKARLEAAAAHRGEDLASFLITAGLDEAERPWRPKATIGRDGIKRVRGGPPLPKHLRIAASEARHSRDGYALVAWHVARELSELLCGRYEGDDDQLETAQNEFDAVTDANAYLALLEQHLPHVMCLVPRRRRDTFLNAFAERVEEDGLGW